MQCCNVTIATTVYCSSYRNIASYLFFTGDGRGKDKKKIGFLAPNMILIRTRHLIENKMFF